MAMLPQQTLRESFKMYLFGHAKELHVICQLKLLQAVAHHIPTKPYLKEGGKVNLTNFNIVHLNTLGHWCVAKV